MEAQRGQAASPNGSAEFVQRAGEASGPLNSFCPLADADGALRSLVWLQPTVLAKGNLLRKGRCLLLGDEPSILGRERRRGWADGPGPRPSPPLICWPHTITSLSEPQLGLGSRPRRAAVTVQVEEP